MNVARMMFALSMLALSAAPAYGQAGTERKSGTQTPTDSTEPAATSETRIARPKDAPPIPSAAILEQADPASEVFGASLFRGRFAGQSFRGFNPDYVISVGDRIDLKLWGAVDLSAVLEVDSQGNIFIPRVGPVTVANTRNADLNALVSSRVRTVYRDNVGVYASLAAAEPVKVFVTGYVRSPGLYGAYASDSLLHFLDQAGGVDPQTGSFLDIRVLRAGATVGRFDLYDFLLRGELSLFQFHDGDTIVVWPRKSTAKVSGLVRTPAQFEFRERIALADLLAMAGVEQQATHVLLVRHQTAEREAEYIPITPDIANVFVVSGDEVSVFADRQVGTIVATVEGEFEGLSQFALPYDSTLSDVLEQIRTTERSNLDGLQVYRQSIAVRQQQVLDEMLRKLEHAVLNARSGTAEEAALRVREAELVMRFIERARSIKPRGQLVMPSGTNAGDIALEDRDVIRIPRRSSTVAVQGEVFFPNAFVHRPGMSVDDYIEQAGGLTQKANRSRIFIMRPSGEMVDAAGGWRSPKVEPGDEIMVLPTVDAKNFQLTKDLVQVLYQIALSAGVVLSI
jgi:protein involved in polysaccharide export with SLBB domain